MSNTHSPNASHPSALPNTCTATIEEQRWAAVVARDSAFDGSFVYCVRTTKIFCRPVCKARLARRANVMFYATAAEAQAAGYRACKRCQPTLFSYSPQADKIKKACALLSNVSVDDPLPRSEVVARQVGLSKHHFHRLFKRETGSTPREYALANMSGNVTNTNSISTPIPTFNQETMEYSVATSDTAALGSVDPADFPLQDWDLANEGGSTTSIVYYSTAQTSHGVLLVAFEGRTLRKIQLEASMTEVMHGLETTFPSSTHLWLPIIVANDSDSLAYQQRINAITAAMEHSA